MIKKYIAKETVGQYEVSIARACNLFELHPPMDHSGITRISHRAIHAIEKKNNIFAALLKSVLKKR